MFELEEAKKRYYELEERRNALLKSIADEYDFDGDIEDEDGVECFLEQIHCADVILDGNDDRDLMYIEDMMLLLELLIKDVQVLSNGNDLEKRGAKKGLDVLVRKARSVKKSRKEDIKKAQEVISAMDDVIAVCDKYRK